MNNFELVGVVGFGKDKTKRDCVKEGVDKSGKQYKIMSFSLYSKSTGYLDCKTFDWDIIDNLMDGDRIELTSYVPQKSSWTNQTTGIKNYKTEIRVNELKFLGRGEQDTIAKGGWVDARKDQPQTITKSEVDAMFESEEIKDIEKTLDDLNNENEQDSVNLDEVFKGL